MPRAVVFLAEGFEEVEAVTPIDYLRRAGAEVVIAGVGTKCPRGARGIAVQADADAGELSGYFDAAVLPGGLPGADNLAASAAVRSFCEELWNSGKLIAAICASPAVVLGSFGMLKGRSFTCYPGGNLITSRGAGTAGEFALAIISYLFDREKAAAVGKSVLFK
ncbi:MAG: DJ-1 family protein [Spirochaetales bacterium]|nr:MAG: DJ-1 family protein [Spirochaetales bacterium]